MQTPTSRRDPLRSQYPGELALRDLPTANPTKYTGLIVARFAVLQLVERIAQRWIEPHLLPAELEGAAEYIPPVRERAPADALRLERLLDRIGLEPSRSLISGLLAAGDTASTQLHRMGAFGLYHAAFVAARQIKWDAAALSAADRLALLSLELGRAREAARWQRRRTGILARCH